MMNKPEFVYAAAALICCLIAAFYDVKSRRVPNILTGPSILFAILLHFGLGGWRELGNSLLAGLICGVAFVIFYIAGGMGAGDVKLITAVGCLAGLPRVAPLLILTALSGGVMAVGLVIYRRRIKDTFSNIGSLVLHHRLEGIKPHPALNVTNSQTLRLPYALAITAGMGLTISMMFLQR